jgi:hypothetical protein
LKGSSGEGSPLFNGQTTTTSKTNKRRKSDRNTLCIAFATTLELAIVPIDVKLNILKRTHATQLAECFRPRSGDAVWRSTVDRKGEESSRSKESKEAPRPYLCPAVGFEDNHFAVVDDVEALAFLPFPNDHLPRTEALHPHRIGDLDQSPGGKNRESE